TLLSQQMLDRSLYIMSMAAHQGSLYIKADKGLYRFAPGDEEALLLLESNHTYAAMQEDSNYYDVLLSDAETLYAMNNQSGTLRPMLMDDSEVSFGDVISLDWSDFIMEEDEYTYTLTPTSLVIYDEYLYMLADNYEDQVSRATLTLLRASLRTGELQAYDALQTIKQLTPYKDGKLLVMMFDEENSYNEQTGLPNAPDLGVFDPQTGTVDNLGLLKEGMENYWSTAITYDPVQDIFYFTDGNIIYSRQAMGEPVACAFLPSDFSYTSTPSLMVLDSGRLTALTNIGIVLREDNPQKMMETSTLVIAGYADYDIVNRLAALMPEVRIDSQSLTYYSSEELAQAMLSRSSDADIIVLDTSIHQVSSFLQKGYALQLTPEGEAAKLVAAMYPMLRDLAIQEDKTYALPIGLDFTVDMMTKSLFKEVGLPIPEDFFAICDTLQLWADDIHEKYPEYSYWMTFNNKDDLYNLALELYRDALRSQGLDLSFDTTLFRDMMARIRRMDTRAIDVDYDWQSSQSQEIEEELYSKTAMIDVRFAFSPDMTHQPFQTENKWEITLFSAEAGGKKVTAGSARLLAVNPFSKNQEAALRFIQLYAAAMPPINKVMLMPEFNEPILNPYFEEEMAGMTEYLALLKKQSVDAKVDSLAGSEIEADILMMETMLKDAQTTMRYLLTEEDILSLREIMDMVYIPTALHSLEDRVELYAGFEQFKEGVISLDQFIMEADSKLRMMRLENK
ncbi:MAG: hypothetical protein GX781_03185, partial [Clostridiales bacterium]|nr:hypothetical protein [Clostridiales bacterium]